MSKERAKRTFSELRPGDVLVNFESERDIGLILRVEERVDILQLYTGRLLESWIAADVPIAVCYDVIRGGEVLFHHEEGYKRSCA